jgi:periplasmic protein CpxP/Spy
MMKRIVLYAGLAAALVGGSALAAAQPPQGGPGVFGRGPRAGSPADFGLRGIDLTDAQREQVRAIMESNRTALEQASKTLREAHRAFAEATAGATIDEAALRARSTTLAGAMADEAIVRSKVRAEVHALLTPEQQQQLQARPQPRRRGP